MRVNNVENNNNNNDNNSNNNNSINNDNNCNDNNLNQLIMETPTSQGKHEIQLTDWMRLDGSDFLDYQDLSHTHEIVHIKATSAAASASVSLNKHKGKSKILKYNMDNTNPITLDGETLEDLKTFMYLGSIIDEHGGSDADVKERIGKARTALLQLKNIWNSEQLSTNIKVRIFNKNIKTVLLHGTETWTTTTTIIKKVQVFINECPLKVLNARWPNIISNSPL
ncbi:unnamed protein product [Schistosoma curassoni]|uniref:DUF6451 domain-containing protein n=1 Tax=Schistosoma curassoni TaxID=6186 RepID=A0A183KY24_9TREM|nr:unnamed protein product [Schistosoma curassoni]